MTNVELAIKYYKALYSRQYDVVKTVASPNLIFEDATAPPEFGIPAKLSDLESFLEFMSVNSYGDVDISFTDQFESNDRVVLMTSSKGIVPAERVGMGKEGIVEYASQGVSILYVNEGKVKRHTDYFNYPALASSFKRIE